jgi:radical SAM/Cys-rich protein
MTESAQKSIPEPLNSFDRSLEGSNLFPLKARGVAVLQINMGRLCNQACRHCHVEAGPDRTELMSSGTVDECLRVVRTSGVRTVDITGGAPEMNPEYRRLVSECASLGAGVMTRTNLTVLTDRAHEDMPRFWADLGVEVVTSLPYYQKDTVERLRGDGVFDKSIEALKRLNSAGYGVEGGLTLNLVYNPCGAYMPPSQKSVEADFKRELEKRHGVSFTNLFTITNMPLGRFLGFLAESGNLERYTERLRSSYNAAAAGNVMCRDTVSVGWDGVLYDCDFNQAENLKCGFGSPGHIRDFDAAALGRRRIVTSQHCYGCTAGAGSSCTGAVA